VSDTRELSAVELPASTGGELGDFTSALRRQKWVLVLVAALVAIAGTVLVLRRPATYTSTAALLVPERADGAGARGDSLVDLSTQRQVLRSETVAATAAERLADVGLEDADADDLAARVDVEVPVDTRVLRLTASGDDARQARAVARAFVSAYRDLAYLNAIADRNALIDVVEGELADAEGALEEANDALGAAPSGSVAELEARSRRSVVTDRITSLQDRRNELLATPLPQVRVLTPASAGTTTGQDIPVRDLALVLMVAFVLGVIAAVLWDRVDDRVRDGDAIEKALGAPLLASVPAAAADATDLAVVDDPIGPAADAYRQLRVGVLGSPEIPGGTILLAGVRGAEGMADVAANLAMALAATGRSVAVVTVDGERPDVADRFDVDGPGLAEVLSGVVALPDALLQPRWLPVSVLPRGSRDVPVSDLVQSEAMHRMHRTLLAETDFVLLAAPPVLAAADTVAMASLADAAVLVTSAKRTSARDLRAVRARMARVGFPVLGAVLHGSARAPAGPRREGPLEALPPASPADDGAESPVPAGAPR
jgi:Mrp family chromosome partitioning ATPase/capsular polysaccharide biosynthesis protein